MLRRDQARNVECKRYETAENIDHLNKKKFKKSFVLCNFNINSKCLLLHFKQFVLLTKI